MRVTLTDATWQNFFALAIIRYDALAFEYARRLRKCQVIGDSVKITVAFSLLHIHCLEKKSFPFHVHKQGSLLTSYMCYEELVRRANFFPTIGVAV